LVLGASLALLGACSVVKVAYSNLDVYLRWKADAYFSLERDQSALLDERLDAVTSWHRREELPRYAALLVDARDRVGAGLSEADLDWFIDSARARYGALARRCAADAAELLGMLSAGQIARFEARLKRDNDRFAEEYVAPPLEVQRQRRYETTLDAIQDWTGTLSEAQQARLKELSFEIPLTNAMRGADRQRRQARLIPILKQPGSETDRARALEAWMLEWDQGRAPDYERAALEARRQTIALVLEVDRSLTSSQRSRVQAKLERYAADFTALGRAFPARAERAKASPPSQPPVSAAPQWAAASVAPDRQASAFPVR
jgi:hypothetical protein